MHLDRFVFGEGSPEGYRFHHEGVHVECHCVRAVLGSQGHEVEAGGVEGGLAFDCHGERVLGGGYVLIGSID